MRAVRFRALTCSFVVVSRQMLLMPTHWVNGGSIICPKAVKEPCGLCPGMRSRWMGYAAVRQVGANGDPLDLELAELPESLARLVGSLHLHVLQGPALWVGAHGVAVLASREAERRPWVKKARELVEPKTVIEASAVIDQVARLFGLPLCAEARTDDFQDRLLDAIVAKHSLVLRTMPVGSQG